MRVCIRYTDEEKEIVRQYYRTDCDKLIELLPRRSRRSIHTMASKLKLTGGFLDGEEYTTVHAAAKYFGVNDEIVTQLIAKHNVKTFPVFSLFGAHRRMMLKEEILAAFNKKLKEEFSIKDLTNELSIPYEYIRNAMRREGVFPDLQKRRCRLVMTADEYKKVKKRAVFDFVFTKLRRLFRFLGKTHGSFALPLQ